LFPRSEWKLFRTIVRLNKEFSMLTESTEAKIKSLSDSLIDVALESIQKPDMLFR
jgi:hypothetical protein